MTTTITAPVQSRMQLKPAGAVRGMVDGAWWPESRDLAHEVAAVADSLRSRLPNLERVGYSITDWDPVDVGKFVLDGRRVRLEGFSVRTSGTVRFVGANGSLTFALVPPDTDPRAARGMMTRGPPTRRTRSRPAHSPTRPRAVDTRPLKTTGTPRVDTNRQLIELHDVDGPE